MKYRCAVEPISPELVLVDPDLAREARSKLGDPAKSNGSVPPSSISSAALRRRIVGAGAVAESASSTVGLPIVRPGEAAAADVPPEPGPHHVVRPKLLVVVFGLIGFILGVFLPPIGTGGDPPPSRNGLASGEERPASMTPRLTTPTVSAVKIDGRTDESQTESRPAPRPAGTGSVKEEERQRQSKISEPGSFPTTGARGRGREASGGRIPTRLFVWLPSRGATYYRVRFLKGNRTIFEAWPTDARVAVPLRGTFRGRSFAFTKDRYRWIVQPAFGPRSEGRYGEPIVRSIWVLRP
jgi:hypothetical protein